MLAKRNHINLRTDFAWGANLGPPMSALGRRFEAPDYGRPSHEYCQGSRDAFLVVSAVLNENTIAIADLQRLGVY